MNRSDVRLSLIPMRIASGLPTWIIRLRMALSMRASACWPAQERAIDGTALAFLVSTLSSDLTHPLIARFNVPLASFDRTDGGIAPRRNHRLNRQGRSRLGIGRCAVSTLAVVNAVAMQLETFALTTRGGACDSAAHPDQSTGPFIAATT